MSVEQIVDRVQTYGCGLVEITGGEPLLQKETPSLAKALIQNDFSVLVETNGTQDINRLPKNSIRIMDIKCPGSGETPKMDWDNIQNCETTMKSSL